MIISCSLRTTARRTPDRYGLLIAISRCEHTPCHSLPWGPDQEIIEITPSKSITVKRVRGRGAENGLPGRCKGANRILGVWQHSRESPSLVLGAASNGAAPGCVVAGGPGPGAGSITHSTIRSNNKSHNKPTTRAGERAATRSGVRDERMMAARIKSHHRMDGRWGAEIGSDPIEPKRARKRDRTNERNWRRI